ncbi:BMP and activin membrane-bound inhibitor homolog [Limulus polyphemus]|uniref:BMP and activin membrane-bound inhibitor homolog n=1 Tax=Limulus polyphemus TaxID=6850 RepID=A0ABM1SZ80_LIMPO|nr:BMP and activin membrane-bound inhibitor homolog [Limulus polyphemus]
MLGRGDGVSTQPMLQCFLIILAVVYCDVRNVAGEIRCYCNFPICINTGYMCKSGLGSCFSEYRQSTYSNGQSRASHGCLEFLKDRSRALCNQLSRHANVSKQIFSKLLCCEEDMCNYMSVNIRRSNISFPRGMYKYKEGIDQAALEYDLWFRAAVIAVPIIGICILILLVLIAARMLRQDSRRRRQFLELQRQRQFKAHLLLGDRSGSNWHGIYKHLAMSRDSWCSNISVLDKPVSFYNSVTAKWDDYNKPTVFV